MDSSLPTCTLNALRMDPIAFINYLAIGDDLITAQHMRDLDQDIKGHLDRKELVLAEMPNFPMYVKDIFTDDDDIYVVADDAPNFNGGIVLLMICIAYSPDTALKEPLICKIKEVFGLDKNIQSVYDGYLKILPEFRKSAHESAEEIDASITESMEAIVSKLKLLDEVQI
jgi:hypothetical protein